MRIAARTLAATLALLAAVAMTATMAFAADGKPEAAPKAGGKVAPASPAALAVTVAAAEITLRDGKKVQAAEAKLCFDPPEIKDQAVKGKAPRNHAKWYDGWQPWPGKGKDGKLNTLDLSPKVDEQGTQILGGLYRSIVKDSVVVTSGDGSKTFKMGEDYKYLEDWGQIANVDNRLGAEFVAEIKASCKYALQRLDLVQVDAAGKVTVKKGKSSIVCPALPAPDAGAVALAGVYVAPWLRDGKYIVTGDDIYPINPAAPAQPINKDKIAATMKKLAAGQEVKIAFNGDSVTSGAEVPQWWTNFWTEKNLGYPSVVVMTLRQKFPKANVVGIDAFKGGTGTKEGVKMLEEKVIPAKPDLVLICFGLNDINAAIGGKPTLSPEQFKEALRAMVKKVKEAGAEVAVVTQLQPNPFMLDKKAERYPAIRQAILEVAKEEQVAGVDVYADWLNQATCGVPPFTQLHNWHNHPGIAGHQVFSDAVLRLFE